MKLVVVLKMGGLSIPVKVHKARAIVSKMTGNSNFVSPSPTLEEVNAVIDEAEQSYVAARDAGKAETARMNEAVDRMEWMIRRLAFYVQTVARENTEIVYSAGLELKRSSKREIFLLEAKEGDMPGEVKLIRKSGGNRVAYLWQHAEDNGSEPVWIDSGVTNISSNTIVGLKSESPYLFRVTIVENNHQQPWSEGIRFIVK